MENYYMDLDDCATEALQMAQSNTKAIVQKA
jgi:hypothetical protein